MNKKEELEKEIAAEKKQMTAYLALAEKFDFPQE